MSLRAVYKKSRKALNLLVAATIINFSCQAPAVCAEYTPYIPLLSQEYNSKKKPCKDSIIDQFQKKIKQKADEHLRRKSVYIEENGRTRIYTDNKGFNQEIAPEVYDIYNSANRTNHGFDYMDCVGLQNSNFSEWRYFLSDLVVESAADPVKDKVKDIWWYKRISKYVKSMSTVSASFTDHLNYYIPSRDYKRFKEYKNDTRNAKLKFDLTMELRNLNLYPAAMLKLKYPGFPDVKLKYFPLDSKLKLEIEERLWRNCLISASSYYNYQDNNLTNSLYLHYKLSENKHISLRGSADRNDGKDSEISVFLKTVYKF